MKLLLVLMACALAAAAPQLKQAETHAVDFLQNNVESHNILINALVRQLIAYLRSIINNGSAVFGVPPLDPLEIDHFHISLPAGLINLDLELKGIRMDGIGGFIDNTAALDLRAMTFAVDISVPNIDIRASSYDLVGDLFTAVPLYGKGEARFVVEDFRMKGIFHLKQSEDGKSILIDRVSSPSFTLPVLKSELTGVIGGGGIDAVVNAVIEEVILDYINRFQGAIALVVGSGLTAILNPFLDQLDTWHLIAPFIPRN